MDRDTMDLDYEWKMDIGMDNGKTRQDTTRQDQTRHDKTRSHGEIQKDGWI